MACRFWFSDPPPYHLCVQQLKDDFVCVKKIYIYIYIYFFQYMVDGRMVHESVIDLSPAKTYA